MTTSDERYSLVTWSAENNSCLVLLIPHTFMLVLENIAKRYGDKSILSEISLAIPKGSIISILGPSGCGKTTLLNLILGLVPATSGRILVDGENVTNVPMEKRGFNIVFQDYALFPNLNAEENIVYGLKNCPGRSTPEEVRDLIHLLGLEPHLKSRVQELSGGQKQRVAIAGVVAMRPKCIVLDEPTAMLDPNGRKEVIHTVQELNRKEHVTVLLITHYMEEVIEADKVIVMDQGKIVMQGTPKEVFSHVEELKSYRLDVPQATLVAYELQKKGVPLPDGILSMKELEQELEKLRA